MIDRPIFFQESDRPPTREKKSRQRLSRLVVFLVASTFSLLLAEGLTRMIWGRSEVLFPRYHDDVVYGQYKLRRLQPATTFRHTSADGSWLFKTNAQGFRDTRDYDYEKAPGVRRILCLGDSQTQGFEARQDRVYPAIIERRLGRLGHRVEVLNTGISGFGTAEQLAFLENEGIRYKPDVVVLGWFVNDFDDNEKSNLFRLREGILVQEGFEHVPGVAALRTVNSIPPLRWASEHSYFYSMLFNKAWQARKLLLSHNANASMSGELTTRVPHQGADISPYQVDLSAALVGRMHEFCRARGVRLLIVDIPWLPHDNTGFGSSLPDSLAESFAEKSDALLRASVTLDQYRGVADIFVPHGQHHISEMSHLFIGMAVAEKLDGWFNSQSK